MIQCQQWVVKRAVKIPICSLTLNSNYYTDVNKKIHPQTKNGVQNQEA